MSNCLVHLTKASRSLALFWTFHGIMEFIRKEGRKAGGDKAANGRRKTEKRAEVKEKKSKDTK